MRLSTLCVSGGIALAMLVSGCATAPAARDAAAMSRFGDMRVTAHRGDDDLLTGGLGAAGLQSMTPPGFVDAANPTSAELRRRALWSNWRGIADLAPGGGYGTLYGSLAPVPGREYQAFATLDGARQPHRVLLQVPDAFDAGARCIVVTASSGSRGIYGAIALAGAWGLPKGCAVAYTDKGTGTGYFDADTGSGARLDGTRGDTGLEFAPAPTGASAAHAVAFKHAHSQDNPEADWGRHVRDAAQFALHALAQAVPAGAPYTFDNTRVIAVGLSNGGGAVLRAAELDGNWLDGVVAAAPNVWPGDGGRALYDYVTEAALLMPCALLDPQFDGVAMARPGGVKPPAAFARCESAHAAGLLAATTPETQIAEARERLRAGGWSDAALEAAALSTTFDLWRAVAAAYASAYTRSSWDAMPCGYSYAALDASLQPRATTPEERAAWWSDASGIPPGAGVLLVDSMAGGPDPALPALRCLRALWTANDAGADALRAGVQATRASLPRDGLPVIVLHGADDGLIPEALSGGAYAQWATANGRDVRYWRVANAQHFDAFLGLPPLAGRYVPLLPYAYRALDAMWTHLQDGTPLPPSADIATQRRAASAAGIEALGAQHIPAPR
ncbi:3-hydroxybutyrate oligomer hydrolase family protein [Chiayiivirga flava]|uniref:Hydroxybutyrate-dimer hydrolase n=1 Tax=Chiayiivirga flava TaxID=659595 RepID=A0A7W8FZR9_9GAMM|nr:3-hydroxybutyrate oligomer hydrolase family protein [Chiayiivirga flava]MBB5206933.1 hydroxybutyrate-dimer hydrolase [Chiayiivirga flava]